MCACVRACVRACVCVCSAFFVLFFVVVVVIYVAEWYFQCVIVLSQIVGLCVLRCRVGMVGTSWLNLDIYRLSINLIMVIQE